MQHMFCSFFENCRDHMAQFPALHQFDVMTFCYCNRTFQRGQFFCFHIVRVFQDGFNHGHARKRLTEVDFDTFFAIFGITNFGGAVDILRQCAQHLFGQIHQIIVVCIRHIEFQHGEFWVMTNRDTFVTEVTVDFIHTLETTYDQTFQIQLWCDTQIHVDIQRIVVRDKWTRRRTTRNHLHHRGFYFHEAFAVQEITDTVDHLIADHERSAGIFVGNQIQVTLTAARFLIGQTFMLFWQRTQSLGQQTDAGGVH